MHFSRNLYAIAILTGPLSSVLGALTQIQITDAIQDLTNMVNNAIADANAVNVATGDLDTSTLVTNNQNIASKIDSTDEALSGSAPLTADEQDALITTVNQYASQVANLFDALGGKAADFLVPSDKAEIQESANGVSTSNDAFLGDLETLGTTVGRAADELREDDDAADQDMNNDFAESPARRKLVFKA